MVVFSGRIAGYGLYAWGSGGLASGVFRVCVCGGGGLVLEHRFRVLVLRFSATGLAVPATWAMASHRLPSLGT